jgi:hypothetical protein
MLSCDPVTALYPIGFGNAKPSSYYSSSDSRRGVWRTSVKTSRSCASSAAAETRAGDLPRSGW